ncbi:hypothetical protein H1C71_012082 [Ictidomys tridecemlineatus]|nr:hypothetical protein H1C71_012082 [Ictidomys tridecemlineatus]
MALKQRSNPYPAALRQLRLVARVLLPAHGLSSVVEECTVVVTALQRDANQLQALLRTGPTFLGWGWSWCWRSLGAWALWHQPCSLEFSLPTWNLELVGAQHALQYGDGTWSGSSLAQQGTAYDIPSSRMRGPW